MIKRGDKHGQGLSTNAIILIVLGVLVLIVLILGFTLGWSRIAPWLGSSNNVDQIVQECGVACSTNSVYGYCSQMREVKLETDEEYTSLELVKDDKYTCNNLKGKLGVQACASITCPSETTKTTGEETP